MSPHLAETDTLDEHGSTLLIVRTLIFPKLSLVYGQRLALMYEGLNQEAVMADWANELSGMSIQGVTYALKHLPATDFPPNVQQFRRLCCERPTVTQRQHLSSTTVGTAVPTFVFDLLRRVRDTKVAKEPQEVRVARAYIARVTAPQHCTTHTERCWLRHYAQVIDQYEQRVNGDAQLPKSDDTPESRVPAYRVTSDTRQELRARSKN